VYISKGQEELSDSDRVSMAKFMEQDEVREMRDMCLMRTESNVSASDAQKELLKYLYAVVMSTLLKLKFPLVAVNIGVESTNYLETSIAFGALRGTAKDREQQRASRRVVRYVCISEEHAWSKSDRKRPRCRSSSTRATTRGPTAVMGVGHLCFGL
jgi:hypothetical protein